MDTDCLDLLCTKGFPDEEIAEAKAILKDICVEKDVLGDLRITNRTGADKSKRNISDILAMFHKLGDAQ